VPAASRRKPDHQRASRIEEGAAENQNDLQKDQPEKLKADRSHQPEIDQLPPTQSDTTNGIGHQLVQPHRDVRQRQDRMRHLVR
jgi:hypothetical protein